MAFSGSAVVDRANTGGWKTGKEDVLVGAYTSTGRGECIIYSNDRGRTWSEYSGNPVVKHQGRDPRLLWHEPTHQWVMCLYDEGKENGKDRRSIDFYTSPDLKTWTKTGRADGYFECPDMFQLPVEGKPAQSKWVLLAADGNYALGDFDGRQFNTESGKHRGNWGNCFYAAQTWSDTPDGRRIQIGWGQVKLPGMPFNQMMLFPCELALRETPEGLRMTYTPAKEIEKLHDSPIRLRNEDLTEGENPLSKVEGDLWDLQTEIRPGDAKQVGLTIRGIPLTYDVANAELTCLDRKAPVRLSGDRLKLRILADHASLEIFADDGLVYMPLAMLPKAEDHSLAVWAQGGKARVVSLKAYPMRSAWPAPK
jgi:fructan beta-fructosidase